MHRLSRTVEKVSFSLWVTAAAILLLAGGLSYASWYGYERLLALEARNAALEAHIASTAALMQESIAEVEALLGDELEGERARLAALQSRLGEFQREVGTISGNVSTLEKLTRTDKELLQKYSRVFFLNEHYAPHSVTEIPNEYKYNEQRNYAVHAQVYPYMKNMLDEAKRDGVELYVFSAYRPFEEQGALNNQYKVIYGAGTANQFSAEQGYSEHQLGTAVDFMTTGIGGTLSGFERTEAYQWLLANAHRFGFTLSYPEGNDYYIFEPWHWRFVGVKLASDLRAKGMHFYDMEQRDIDEYLVHLFD